MPICRVYVMILKNRQTSEIHMGKKGTLIFFCGKMGSGKSTLSRKISPIGNAILISEDEWLKTLYPTEIMNFEDYLKYSSRLKVIIKPHVQNILNSGVSVVMDFPGNTEKQRVWFKKIYTEYGFPHKLMYIEASDNLCIRHIKKRAKTNPQRAQFDTEDIFHQVTGYFQPPSEHECFTIEIVRSENSS